MSDVPSIRSSVEPRPQEFRPEARIPEAPAPAPAPRPRDVEVTERTPYEDRTVGTQLDIYA